MNYGKFRFEQNKKAQQAKKKQKKRLQQQAASKAHLRYNQAILKDNMLCYINL